jgi:hypothetical protein
MQTVTIGSKLPFGFILKNPIDPTQTVTLRGLNQAPKGRNGVIMQVPYMTTEVDKEFWDLWFAMHTSNSRHPFGPLKSGALFVAGTPDRAEAVHRDREKDKTGMEGLVPEDYNLKTRTDD